MWTLAVFVCITFSWAAAQNGRTSAHQDHSGHGWDIRLAVPGEPGNDYPTLGAIPRTSFSCAGKEPGYYADLETNCQVFRVCTVGSTYGFQSFLCPNGTLFNQAVFVCDWWMNVNCPASEQLFNNNNDKFGNLRLGPQLMKDIKKMLTHPMRNPYDKTAMKSNLIVMQDYKAPLGQLFPNGALIAGPERPPNNIYVPAKQIQAATQNGYNNNDIAFAASTPDPRYLPAAFNTLQQSIDDAQFFQRQRQNAQYVQSNRIQNSPKQRPGTILSNGHTAQFTQNNYNANLQSSRPTQSYNSGNLQYGQRQLANTRPTQAISTQNSINFQRGQLTQQNSQYTNNQNPARMNNGKQAEFGISYNKQQFTLNQEKQPYAYKQPQLQFSNEVNGKVGNEAKQNLALVFSLLADSINVAKDYNIAQQAAKQSIPSQPQFQNVNNNDLTQITNKISQLTSSQYSGNNNAGYKSAKLVSTAHPTTIQGNQSPVQFPKNEKLSQKQIQSVQIGQYNLSPTQANNQLQNNLLRYQSDTNSNIQSNSKQLYSGQLYQLPVPDVTNQIYNRQNSANLAHSNANLQQNQQTKQNTNEVVSAMVKSTSPDVEIIQSQSIPLPPAAKLQASLSPSELDNFSNSQENFNKFLNANSGITAQLQDKIVGIIPHPYEDNKLVTYKKDESYYVYTKLDNKFSQDIPSKGNFVQANNIGQQSAKLVQGNNIPNLVSFQFIPSVSYQLEDEKEQQKILNAFHIDEFGNPRQENNLVQSSSQPILTTNVDYTVDHAQSGKQIERLDRQFNDISTLYVGPSSYSAPQASVGRLGSRQYNSRLELDDNNNGYSKVVPGRQFTF